MDLQNIWSNEWTNDVDFISIVISHLKLKKDSKILDIGTGQGIMAVSLAVNGYEVTTGEPEAGHEAHQLYEQEKNDYDHSHEHAEFTLIGWEVAAELTGVLD